MWGSTSKSSAKGKHHTLISRGTKIVGDIQFDGDLQIEGRVQGCVLAEGEQDGCLVIHEGGCVEGEVRVPTAVVNGEIIGDMHSTKHLELAAKAIIQGNVYYETIEMVKGSQVNGNLVHAPKAGSVDVKTGQSKDTEPSKAAKSPSA